MKRCLEIGEKSEKWIVARDQTPSHLLQMLQEYFSTVIRIHEIGAFCQVWQRLAVRTTKCSWSYDRCAQYLLFSGARKITITALGIIVINYGHHSPDALFTITLHHGLSLHWGSVCFFSSVCLFLFFLISSSLLGYHRTQNLFLSHTVTLPSLLYDWAKPLRRSQVTAHNIIRVRCMITFPPFERALPNRDRAT